MLRIKTNSKKIKGLFENVRGITIEPSEDGLSRVCLEVSSSRKKSNVEVLEEVFAEAAYVHYWLKFNQLKHKKDYKGMLKIAVDFYRPPKGWGRGLQVTKLNENFAHYEPVLVPGEQIWTLHKLLDLCRAPS